MICTNIYKRKLDPEKYTFESVVPGEDRTVYAGMGNVKEEDLLRLERWDNCEAESNIDYVTGTTKTERRERKQKWEKEHPGEPYEFQGYTISMDALRYEGELAHEGESEQTGEPDATGESVGSCNLYGNCGGVSPQVERMREIIEELPERERKILIWVKMEGCSQEMAAKRLDISQKHVSRLLKKIEKQIAQDSVLKRIYGC